MASKRGVSSGQDVVDVLAVVRAFEEMNKCAIQVRMFTQSTSKLSVLQVVISAWNTLEDVPEAKQLASHQSSFGFHTPQSVESVILQGLYRLDAQLAEKEFATAISGERSFPAKA